MRVGRFRKSMEASPDKNFDGLIAYAGATRFRFLSMNAAALGSVFSAPPQLELNALFKNSWLSGHLRCRSAGCERCARAAARRSKDFFQRACAYIIYITE